MRSATPATLCSSLLSRQCKEGAALWEVLQLNDSYNLDKHLNISQVREHSGSHEAVLLELHSLLWNGWRRFRAEPRLQQEGSGGKCLEALALSPGSAKLQQGDSE